MALTFFRLTGTLESVNPDTSSDEDGLPDLQPISSTVTISPSVSQVYADGKLVRLNPIVARTTHVDGTLKNTDGSEVQVPANVGLGLSSLVWTVSFSDVVYNKLDQPTITSFSFEAPKSSGQTLDFATLTRLP